MIVNVCQMNIHSWDVCEYFQNRQSRVHKRCLKDLKRISGFSPLAMCVYMKERERKQQLKTIFCESVAGKDVDSKAPDFAKN